MYCSNCGNKNKEKANFCINCGIKIDIITYEETDTLEYLENNPNTIVRSDTNEVINDNKDKNFTKKIFNGIGVGGAYIGGGILLLILTVVRFLYIASAGISMVWASIALFKSGSIFLGIVVLLIGTPVAISIASYFFIPLLLFSILTLIVWGIASILGFDISFSNVWDMLWFGVKILILGAIAFWGISSFIRSVRENNTLNFFKENWFYILIFLFMFWLFFPTDQTLKSSNNDLSTTNQELELNKISDPYIPNWTTYTSEDDKFSILFNSNPKIEKYVTQIDRKSKNILINSNSNVSINSVSYRTTDKINKNDYYVDVYTFPDTIRIVDSDGLLNEILSLQTSSFPKTVIVHSISDFLNQNNIIDATFDGTKEGGEFKRKRLVLVGNRVYDIQSYSVEGNYNKEITDKFIDSFKPL